LELATEATESVTTGVSTSSDGPVTLLGENLEEVFGIEIEPAALHSACDAVSKLNCRNRARRNSPGTHLGFGYFRAIRTEKTLLLEELNTKRQTR